MQLVRHDIYGKGKIKKRRFGGFELYVEFEDGIGRWVRRDEIRFLPDDPASEEQEPLGSISHEEQFKARQIVEALRLGIVPHKYVEEFTFGRKREAEQIRNWMSRRDEGSLLIIGEYGAGKTHLLEYIYSIALRDGWAVSLVELDPNESPLHKPKTIYRKIISSFRFGKKKNDFREFLRQIANNSKWHKLKEHAHLGPVIQSIRNNKDTDDYLEWIEGLSEAKYPTVEKHVFDSGVIIEKKGSWIWVYGRTYHIREELKRSGFKWSKKKKAWYKPAEEEKSGPMPNSYTSANIYSYIISGIGWAARNILGLEGFLILFDEAESIDSYWYTSYQSNRGWNFLKGLVLMSNNDKRLLDEVIKEDFYEHPSYGGYWGNITDLQYYGRSRLPFIWKVPCHVKIIFTLTPTPKIVDRDPLNSLSRFEIEHLDNKSLMEISKAIFTFYKKAYNFCPDRDCLDLIPESKTRLFIKGTVELLDLMRFHPDKALRELSK